MRALIFDKSALVLDAASKRIEDTKNGFLRVADNPFTREQVVQYRGHEIPNWQEHGLERDKLYNVFRPANELRRPETIASLNGIPLLLEHETYDPDNPPVRRQIGSAGTDAKWVPPYLTNSLIFTNTKAINLLKSGAMKELSLGYYYTPVFKSGKTPDGKQYDLVMSDIVANHIALVEEGRAGHDVAVHDSKPKGLRESTNMEQNQDAVKQVIEQTITSLQSLINLLAPEQAQQPQATDQDDDQTMDDDDQNDVITDPTMPENSESVDPEDEQEANLDDDDQALDEDDDQAMDDDDEQSPIEDEDDDQAMDEDEDEQAQDNDESAIEAALKDAGLSDASDDVKQAFIKGMQKAAAAAKAVAQDSKRSRLLVSKVLSSKVKNEVRKAVHDARLRDKAKIKAANEVRSVLGVVDAMAYDSASAIYKAGLVKLGYTRNELKRLSGNEARAAFRGAKRGGMSIKRNAMAVDSKRRMSNTDIGFKKLLDIVSQK